mmetsp:Transcript_106077/g.265706  ORF Transcript_106077/g.265706 Transcript_106077/m.265706 type:complete len:230 (+) Transcript_106077:946-1635(+)
MEMSCSCSGSSAGDSPSLLRLCADAALCSENRCWPSEIFEATARPAAPNILAAVSAASARMRPSTSLRIRETILRSATSICERTSSLKAEKSLENVFSMPSMRSAAFSCSSLRLNRSFTMCSRLSSRPVVAACSTSCSCLRPNRSFLTMCSRLSNLPDIAACSTTRSSLGPNKLFLTRCSRWSNRPVITTCSSHLLVMTSDSETSSRVRLPSSPWSPAGACRAALINWE